MTRDELERALRAGVDPHERAYRAAPLPASVEEAQSRLAIRRASGGGALRFAGAMVAAALVVVAVVAGYGLVTRGPDSGGGPAASDSGSIVPTASASASASAGARPCRAADFAITSDPWDAGAGSRGTRVVFRALDSLDACVLGGRLVASIVDAQGAALVTAESDVTPTATVTGGAQLEIGVAWSNWCGASPAEPLELRVRFPFDASEAAVVPPAGTAVLVPPCMGAGQDTALSVTRFEASNRPPPEG